MYIKMTATALVLAVFGAGYANAENTAQPSADKAFEAMDADGNGSISKTEFNAYAKDYATKQKADFDKQYAELDANKDGKVDKDEAGANAALEAYFDQIDENSDGFVTKEEIGSAIMAANEASAAK
jgi:Ca2+-binding EF-hand superfamily protein